MPSIAHDLSPELWILICIRARHASPLCMIAQACMSQLQNAKPRRRVRCVICPHNFDHCTRIGLQSHSAVCVCIRKVADICQRASRMQPARMEPAGFFRRIPLLPHQMLARLTPTADMIVLCHMGVPRLDPRMVTYPSMDCVERPTRLGFAATDCLSQAHRDQLSSVCGQSAATVRADAAHLQRSLDRGAACGCPARLWPGAKCTVRMVVGGGLRCLRRHGACSLCQGSADRARARRRADRL